MKKRVPENLFQFKEYKFFNLFEELKEEGDKETKDLVQNQEETGNAVINKIKDNFTRFEKEANGFVSKYKEFWNENETTRTNFGEGAKVYKMFDSNYVVALMKLPDEALEPATIGSELENVPEDKTEEKEAEKDVKDEAEDKEEKDEEKDDLKEAFEPEEDQEDLDSQEPEAESPIAPEDPASQGPVAGRADPLNTPQIPVEEHPVDDEVLDTPGEPKMCLVVYQMNDEQRDEVFRTSVNSVMHSFEEFYENTFKGAMKAIIAKAKEKLEQVKKEAEVKAKEEEMAAKKTKVDQFLKESMQINEGFKAWYLENREVLKQEYYEEVSDLEKEMRPTFKEWCLTRYEWLKEYEG